MPLFNISYKQFLPELQCWKIYAPVWWRWAITAGSSVKGLEQNEYATVNFVHDWSQLLNSQKTAAESRVRNWLWDESAACSVLELSISFMSDGWRNSDFLFSRLSHHDLVYMHNHTIKYRLVLVFWPILQIKTVSAEDQRLSLTDIRHSGGLTGKYEMNTDSGLVANLSLYPILLTFQVPLEQPSLLQLYLLETMWWDLSRSHYYIVH